MLDEEKILDRLSDLVEQLGQATQRRDEMKVNFKSWCALKSLEFMRTTKSVAAAEKEVQALPTWAEKALLVENAESDVVMINNKIRLGERYFEAWRSKHSAEKRITR